MDSATWVCPHCAYRGAPRSTGQRTVGCCPTCAFAYPVTPADGDANEDMGGVDALDVGDQSDQLPRDRYDIQGLLAQGSQGKLLRARHRHLDLPCVIKTAVAVDAEWAEVAATRLRAEARAGSRVQDVHVARVLDCDCIGSRWYFVMEYVEGINLRTVLEAVGKIPWRQVTGIGIQAAQGLTAIHAAQLVHRDIKPSNLMIDPHGNVRIMDLGLVKIRNQSGDPAATRVGQLLGTPYYMPPEQFDGEENLDGRADVYSLGATLFHLAVGHPPHQGQGVLDLSMRHHRDPLAWPESAMREIPFWWRSILETSLAKRPEHRFDSAAAFAEALQHDEETEPRRHPSLPPTAPKTPQGWAVLRFRNTSARPEDEWIGDAIAEFLSHRLMELKGLRVVDRQALERVLRQSSAEGDTEWESSRILQDARLVGAQGVIQGSLQRNGDRILITAQALLPDHPDVQPLARVEGDVNDLFQLEERLANPILKFLGRDTVRSGRQRRQAAGTENLEAHKCLIRGQRAFAEGDYKEAIRLAEEAARLDPDYLEPLSLMGAGHARIGDYDRAVACHQREEQSARALDDQPRLAESLGNLGVMYYYKGEYPEAFEFLEQAKRLSKDLDLPGDRAKYCANLGFVLTRLDRLEEAETSLAEAIALNRELGDLVSLMWPYNGMGTVLLKQQRYGEAREYYQRALLLAEEVGDRVTTGLANMNLGRCADCLNDSVEASERFQSALSILEGTDFWNGLTLVYEYRAEMHLRLGEKDAALADIDRRIDLARRHNNARMEAAAWEQKARVHELVNDTAQALQCLKHSLSIWQRPVPHESLHRYLGEATHPTPPA